MSDNTDRALLLWDRVRRHTRRALRADTPEQRWAWELLAEASMTELCKLVTEDPTLAAEVGAVRRSWDWIG